MVALLCPRTLDPSVTRNKTGTRERSWQLTHHFVFLRVLLCFCLALPIRSKYYSTRKTAAPGTSGKYLLLSQQVALRKQRQDARLDSSCGKRSWSSFSDSCTSSLHGYREKIRSTGFPESGNGSSPKSGNVPRTRDIQSPSSEVSCHA